jgi:hypothetical protein
LKLAELPQQWAGAEGVDYEFGTLLRDSDEVIVLCERHEARLTRFQPAVARKCVSVPAPPMVKMCGAADSGPRRAGQDRLRVTPDDFLLVYFGYIYSNKGPAHLRSGALELSEE